MLLYSSHRRYSLTIVKKELRVRYKERDCKTGFVGKAKEGENEGGAFIAQSSIEGIKHIKIMQ